MPKEYECLVFAPKFNTGKKHDATGAFQPEQKAFAKRHKIPETNLFLVDNTQTAKQMRDFVLSKLKRVEPVRTIVFMCHGWLSGIQFGFDKTSLKDLAWALARVVDVRVVLYACSTAQGGPGGDGGFADILRDALRDAGAADCQIDAHTTAGHTTKNPYVRRFLGQGAATGGVFIVDPKDNDIWPKWREALKTDFRFDFPYMSVGEIRIAVSNM